MGARGARGAVLAVLAGGLLGLVIGASYLWRTLPPTSGLLGLGRHSSIYGSPPDLPSALAEASLAGLRVALVSQQQNERVTPAGFYGAELGLWRGLLQSRGALLVPMAAAEVIVLPHAVCLSSSLRAAVHAHLERGGGLVTTGAVGARDGRCAELPDTLLHHLVGAGPGDVAPLAVPDGSHYAVLLGETALGAGLPPGLRIELRPADQLAFRGPERELFYTDFTRRPRRVRHEDHFDGAVARARVGAGRVVAFGFALGHAAGAWSEAAARGMAANAVLWAAGRPLAQLAPWPRGARAAAILAQEVEDQFRNASAAAERLERLGVRGTFFVIADQAQAEPAVARRLARGGELGVRVLHVRPLADLSGRRQRSLFDVARRQVRTLTGRPVAGLRLPGDDFDQTTLRAWLAAGGDYVVAANNLRSAGPEIIPLDTDSVVLLPRIIHDDYHWLSADGLRDRGEIAARFLEQFEEVAAYRGLYLLSYHSHILARPELLGVLGVVAGAIAAREDVWVAPAGDVARWWRARGAVRVEPAADGARVDVANRGPGPLDDAVLLVDLPSGERLSRPLPALAPGARLRIPLDADTARQ